MITPMFHNQRNYLLHPCSVTIITDKMILSFCKLVTAEESAILTVPAHA